MEIKVNSYIAQHPILRIVQSAGLFNRTPPRFLWKASSHVAANTRRLLLRTQYLPMSLARYSIIALGELEQCRVNKMCTRFHMAAQYSKLCSLSPLHYYSEIR